MGVLYRYLFRYKGMSLARIITNTCKAGCSVLLSVFLGNILDGLTSANKSFLLDAVLRCIILVTVFIMVYGVDITVTTVQTKKLLRYIKQDIFSKIINGSIEQYRASHSGKYISILNNDITIIKNEFINNFFELIFQFLSFALSLIIMIRISPVVTAIIIGISIISMLVVSKISEKLMQQQKKYSESLENITKLASDIFSGIFVIKNYNITKKIEQLYYDNDEQVEVHRKNYTIIVGIINLLMVCFSMVSYLTIIIFCATSVMNSALSAGTALIIIQLSNNLTEPINEIISLFSSINSVKGIGEKISAIKEREDISEKGKIKKSGYEKGISIDNVTFGYTEEKGAIIKNINLEIEKGKKYAIVGESGSGKTTLLKLLLKYYSNYSGNIFIDDDDIQEIESESYCQLISSMEQDSFIFDETLKDNICLFENYSDAEIQDVIEKADLGQVVKKLPQGLQTVLGEGGANLSGGECKRVAFARLLLKKTPILLLDEATSNLDNNTTMRIEELVLSNKNLTLVSVTHKLIKGILQKYDEVIVLKSGKIIEKGHFDQLILKQGYFYNLYNAQTISV